MSFDFTGKRVLVTGGTRGIGRAAVEEASARSATAVHRIGRIEHQPGLRLLDSQGRAVGHHLRAFDHFA